MKTVHGSTARGARSAASRGPRVEGGATTRPQAGQPQRRTRAWRALAIVGVLVGAGFAGSAHAETIPLNISNVPSMNDGTTYGTVTKTADSNNYGEVIITFTVDSSKVPNPRQNFGLQEVAFNTTLPTSGPDSILGNISNSAGWNISTNSTVDGFGTFTIDLAGTGNDRVTTETIRIVNLGANALTSNFDVVNTSGYLFAAHEAGFGSDDDETGVTSQFIAAQPQAVPEPGSLTLAALGGIPLAYRSWRRRRDGRVSAVS